MASVGNVLYDVCASFVVTSVRLLLCDDQICFSCCDDNKVKMARKPGKKRKENPVGCAGEGKR